jgi:hypothetical protein
MPQTQLLNYMRGLHAWLDGASAALCSAECKPQLLHRCRTYMVAVQLYPGGRSWELNTVQGSGVACPRKPWKSRQNRVVTFVAIPGRSCSLFVLCLLSCAAVLKKSA